MHRLASNMDRLKGFAKVPTSRWNDRRQPRVSLNTLSWTSWASLTSRASRGATALIAALLCLSGSAAWAYKVEKVCTEVAATAGDPAKKTCKIVRKAVNKDAAPKEEKKEEKKKSGH